MSKKQLLQQLKNYKKIAFLPKVKAVQNDYSPTSKFGGFPYLHHENDWCTCPDCDQKMSLLVQLNLKKLPEIRVNKLVQVFYCEEDWTSKIQVIFLRKNTIDFDLESQHAYPQKNIEIWQLAADYPHPEEYWDLEIEDDEDEIEDLIEEEGIGEVISKDKLLGWTVWEQEVNYPTDDAGNEMQLFFQLVSEDNLPLNFGDGGNLYVFSNEDYSDFQLYMAYG